MFTAALLNSLEVCSGVLHTTLLPSCTAMKGSPTHDSAANHNIGRVTQAARVFFLVNNTLAYKSEIGHLCMNTGVGVNGGLV